MPVGLWGAFKYCDGSWSPKPRLSHRLQSQVEVAAADEELTAALQGDLQSGQKHIKLDVGTQEGTMVIKVRDLRDRQVGNASQTRHVIRTGGSENCCQNRLMTVSFYWYESTTAPTRAHRCRIQAGPQPLTHGTDVRASGFEEQSRDLSIKTQRGEQPPAVLISIVKLVASTQF